MEIEIYQLLHDNWLLLLFLVIGLGYLVGNIRIAGTPVGPTIGVLLAGLLFGHYGLTVSPAVGSFGFALFIFSVGIQAGPSFFSAFSSCAVASSALGVASSLGIRRASPGQKMATFLLMAPDGIRSGPLESAFGRHHVASDAAAADLQRAGRAERVLGGVELVGVLVLQPTEHLLHDGVGSTAKFDVVVHAVLCSRRRQSR